MLSPGARSAVERTRPTGRVSLIVTVTVNEALPHVSDRRERERLLDVIYEEAKRPLIDEFHEYEEAGIQIVDELEGTPQLIVSGPARAWQTIFQNPSAVVSDPKVDFAADEPSWSVDPVR